MDEEIYLTDLINAETLQQIQDAFSAMTGMAALTTDSNGIPVTKGSNFTDFCTKYIRKSNDGHMRCEQCDKFGAEDSWKKGGPSSYYCHAGLIDYAAPILADNKMVGSFIGGQVLTEPPDRDKVFETAWDLGIDPQTLWDAIQEVEIMTKEEIDRDSHFLFTIANVLSDMAYGKYQTMQANQEIVRANNMKSDFLANMSHEIRTPMNAVIGMSEMALREELTPAARDYINQIKNSSYALLTIINDILDFSKIESGKMSVIPEEYEPMSLINDLSNILAERLKEKDMELILNISPNLPRILLGDNIRIKQILLNLANNAAKFTDTGQVAIKMSYKSLNDDEILLQCSVEDTGIGIKESDLIKIFDSFQQVDSKRNRNIEGTGLGLAISRRLAYLMGGSISAESIYGQGSIFYFELLQTVVSSEPSVVVNTPEKIHVMSLIDNKYLKNSLEYDCRRFKLNFEEVRSLKEINILPDTSNFLFMEKEKLTIKMTGFIKENPELTAIVLLPFKSIPEDMGIPNLYMIRKPLYSLNEAMFFNHEKIHFMNDYSDNYEINFIAPTANVLIVDDNAINLNVAKGLLEPLQMAIDSAVSGQEAISMAALKHYDLIFMDHMMPNLDGIETTHIIRDRLPEYKDVPIIALTANAIGGMRETFINEGMDDFVPKPIELKTLISKAALWLPVEKIKKTEKAAAIKPEKEEDIVIGDLDTKTAVRMLGSQKLFWTVLKDYYKVIEKKAALIKELEAAEDWEAYTIEVHALKSASKQIGAMPLSEQAAAMEKAGNLKDAQKIHECTQKMLERYLAYLPVLAPFCKEDETKSSQGEITKEVLTGFFADMRSALEELDMDQMENVIQLMSEYSYDDMQKPLFDSLKEAVEEIDADTCEEIMQNWESTV